MNLTEHTALWTKIQQFAFDDPYATITFSRKLANKQNWSEEYTLRVIEEYRRFIFLCCISPTGASPSHDVDECWHLHLTYTNSYWIALCKRTLEKDIHHYPSGGGEQENTKHANWYGDTLTLYMRVFGAAPPADIWPRTAIKQSATNEPAGAIPSTTWLLVALVMIAPFFLSYLLYQQWFPFWLKGPQFLQFFLILAAGAIGAFVIVQSKRRALLQQTIDQSFPADITVYQLTQFVFGKQRALQTALVDLHQRNLIEPLSYGSMLIHSSRYQAPANETNPLALYVESTPNETAVSYEIIADSWYNEYAFTHSGLQALSEHVEAQMPYRKKYWPVIAALLIGAARCIQGLVNDRPITLLVLEMVLLLSVTALVSVLLFRKSSLYNKVKQQLENRNSDTDTDAVVADYALNGQSVTGWLPAALMLPVLFEVFPKPVYTAYDRDRRNDSSSSCSSNSSCSSGDSGSSCSSSDSGSSCSSGCGGCSGGGGD